MKILHISSAQALGGGERHLVDLVKGLASRGHDVFVAMRPNSPLRDELTSLPTRNLLELPLRNALDAKSAAKITHFVAEQKIDIVHAHMARDYPLAAYASRRMPSAKLILTRHVLFPLSRLHKFTLSSAARVIAVSQAVARQLQAQRLISDGKITVVHNGIDFSRFERNSPEDRERFRTELGLPADCLLVGTVGELTPLKGHKDFLHAAAQLRREFSAVYFIIAGVDVTSGQTNLSDLKQLIQKLELDERVCLLGRIPDITDLYRALDVFVSASHTESFGLAIAEAMAAGTSVVATKTEGAQEIVQEGETGLLVPIADVDALARSVELLLRNATTRADISRRASDDVRKRFRLEQMVEATEKIYCEVVGK